MISEIVSTFHENFLKFLTMKICATLGQSSYKRWKACSLRGKQTHMRLLLICLLVKGEMEREAEDQIQIQWQENSNKKNPKQNQEPFENFCRKEENTPILLYVI